MGNSAAARLEPHIINHGLSLDSFAQALPFLADQLRAQQGVKAGEPPEDEAGLQARLPQVLDLITRASEALMGLRRDNHKAEEQFLSVSLRASRDLSAMKARISVLENLKREAEARARNLHAELEAAEARAEEAEARAQRITASLVLLHDAVIKAFPDLPARR